MKSKSNRFSTKTNVDTFADRASKLLNISKSHVEEIFRPTKYKAFRLNGFAWATLQGEEREASRQKIVNSLIALGINVEPIDWYEDGFSFPADQTSLIVESKVYIDGDIFIQNPSSWLPVMLMDPKPGQKIIDMCSSPGGKAMHVATVAGELPIMVEPKQHRFNRLKQSLKESAYDIDSNDSKLINADGKHLPNLLSLNEVGDIILSLNSSIANQGFEIADVVMVDAECSNEAGINFLKKSDPLEGWSLDRVEKCARLQIQLLSAAYKLVKVGGIIIYSTCTLAPEENEAVIAEVIKRVASKGGELVPVENKLSIVGRKTTPITSWNGQKFDLSVSKAVTRIIPGSSDIMDGFCVTKLTRKI
ncbi:MAG: RsmB/NOP family class I SAM-dependent RNA methyltransferase [Acidimicrobiia bacterium]